MILPAEIEAEAVELMSGPPLGDGIGPGNTSKKINTKYGLNTTPEEMWRLWKLYLDGEVTP
jgi:hypothetical protein